MTIYILIGLTVAFFITGIVFIIRGFRTEGEDMDVVPISDFKEVKSLEKSEGGPQRPSPLTSHLVKESIQQPPAAKLPDISLKTVPFAQEKEPEQNQPVISTFPTENKQQSEEQKQRIERLEKDLLEAQQKLSQQAQDDSGQVKKELEQFKQENQSLVEKDIRAAAEVAGLKAELNRVKEEYEAKVSGVLGSTELLESKKNQLAEELKQSQAKAVELNEKLKELEQSSSDRLKEANTEISRLQAQLRGINPTESQELKQQLAGATAAVEELKKERERFMQMKTTLEEKLEKVKEYNAYLLEKDNNLQYELTKSRAQSIGLERICEDFKVQIERLSNLQNVRN